MGRPKRKFPRRLKADEKVSFIQHLEELRYRFIVCVVAVGVCTIFAFLFKERVFGFLAAPLLEALPPDNKQLIFTGLHEAFMVYLKASILAGVLMAAPVLFYQLWNFVSPGLYEQERRSVLPFVLFSSVCFVGGAIFGYYVVFPYGFRFFLGFASEFITPLPTMREYLSFASRLLLAFGLVFELPIFIFFLSRVGLVSAQTLKKGRRYAIPLVFGVAAMFTPPDVVTQIFMAVPLILLYEIGIWVAIIFGKKSTEEDLSDADEEASVPEAPTS